MVGTYVVCFLDACDRAIQGFKNVVVSGLQVNQTVREDVSQKFDALHQNIGSQMAEEFLKSIHLD
eukprot:TRINITY_DN16_c0_g1_i1.p3 TRINITY_DN16_c0_g1~~TRINITY_DN16_c0_g1_i1.p3  ORF type:complete len:65 (-),score=5.71 TRINITY_DN16_c0_g1_i1:62-256(-)